MTGGILPVPAARSWRHSPARRTVRRVFFLTLVILAIAAPITVGASVWISRHEVQSKLLPNDPGSIFPMFRKGKITSADQLLANTWVVGRQAPSTIADPPTWDEDPYQDKYWRFSYYGFRPEQDLLYAWYRTHDRRYLDKLTSILDSFLTTGVDSHWVTSDADLHAAAWRAMSLVNIDRRLTESGDIEPTLEARLQSRIRDEGLLLARDDHFEPGFNHGVNQAAALLLVAANYPAFPQSSSWFALGMDRLQAIIRNVVDADGVEVENSPYYHFYVLNAFVAIRSWAQAFGLVMPETLETAIRGMAHFAGTITAPDGSVPLKGASLPLSVADFDRQTKASLAGLDPALDYLLSGGTSGAPPAPAQLFETSGLAVLRGIDDHPEVANPDNTPDDAWALLDTGPWRTLHSHLDRLGLVLYAGGHQLLEDAGLYQYAPYDAVPRSTYYDKDYFYSTAAHNTVVVDAINQARKGSVSAGATLAGDRWTYQSGQHDLYPGVTHRRAVMLVRQGVVLVVDELVSGYPHTYSQMWHFPVGSQLSVDGLAASVADPTGNPILGIHQLQPNGMSVRSTSDGANRELDLVRLRYEGRRPRVGLRRTHGRDHVRDPADDRGRGGRASLGTGDHR